jgi:hypothetical protein
MVTKVIPAAGPDAWTTIPAPKPVQIDSEPCKQYNEKIVTPHLN